MVTILLLAVLTFIDILSSRDGGNSLLLAQAETSNGVPREAIERFCRDEFLVAYRVDADGVASTGQSAHPVTVAAANDCYQSVLGYQMTQGGFFTSPEQRGCAVLNVAAAREIFGGGQVLGNTFDMDGAVWTVAGVAEDLDDSAVVYIPSRRDGGDITELFALVDGGSVSEEYALTALKSLGVTERGWQITSLLRVVSLTRRMLSAAWQAAFVAVSLVAIVWLCRCGITQLRKSRSELGTQYFTELSKQGAQAVALVFLIAVLVALLAAAILLFSRVLLSFMLEAGRLPDVKRLASAAMQSGRVGTVARQFLAAAIALSMYVISLFITVVHLLRRKKRGA